MMARRKYLILRSRRHRRLLEGRTDANPNSFPYSEGVPYAACFSSLGRTYAIAAWAAQYGFPGNGRPPQKWN
jgi:hypothetical protein